MSSKLQPGTHFSPLNLLEKSENFLSVHRVKLKGEEEKKRHLKITGWRCHMKNCEDKEGCSIRGIWANQNQTNTVDSR